MLSDFLAIRLREALQGARRQAERHGETVLATASAPVDPSAFDLPSLFASRPKRLPAFLWLGTGDHGMVGLDVAWEAVAQGEERFSAIAAAWRRTAANAVVAGEEGPVALGGFRFDPRRPTSELWRGFPDAVLSVPRFVLRLRHGQGHFPAEHWDHIRTSNPIESVFATVRHRTVRTKGALSQDTAKLMVFKLVSAAAKTWRRLQGENQLPKVIRGVTFRDGIEVTDTASQHAA